MNTQVLDNVKILAEQGGDFETGFKLAKKNGVDLAKILHFHRQMEAIRTGKLHPEVFLHQMRETQSTSDFPLLFADSLDRVLMQGYTETPNTWQQWCFKKTVNDFRAAKIFDLQGGEGVNDVIPELGPYPEAKTVESKYEVSTQKRGAGFAYSFEAFINDDLGALNSIPRRMGKRVRRTEEAVLTRLIATNANKAAMFTAGNKNQVNQTNGASANNPALSVSGVIDAMTVLSRMLDTEGQPIVIDGAVILYPVELRATALQIQSALELRTTSRAGDTNNTVVSQNWLGGMFTWVPSYRLAVDAATNPHTGWYMFANPNSGRPAIAAAVLRGHEAPELFMKSSNAVRIGGGPTDPMDGSFENDAINYKVRHFIGGAQIDPKMVVFSEGDNT